jgi:hypothetical protein
MFVCLGCTWFVVWLCMMKGIKVTGKVIIQWSIIDHLINRYSNLKLLIIEPFFFQIVYFTATTPLLLLIILFFRGVHLNGYQEGLALLFIPQVWT